MRKLLIFSILLAVGSGCSSGGQVGYRKGLATNGNIPLIPGGRLAAVLEKTGGSCSVNPYYGTTGTLNGVPRTMTGAGGYRTGTGASTASYGTGSYAGNQGRLEIISLSDDAMSLVGQAGTLSGGYASNTLLTTGIAGTTIGSYENLSGITDQSQIAYTSDGSLILVTMTNLNGGEVWGFPAYDKGGLRSPYRIAVGNSPTEITSARTPFGEFAAVATREGVSLIAMDRFNVRDGTAVPGSFSINRIDTGQPTAVAFSPDGNWLFVGTNPTASGGVASAGGRMYVCNVGVMINEVEAPSNTLARGNLGRGCYPGNSGYSAGTMSGSPYAAYGPGSQTLMGVPRKIAVNRNIAVALTNPWGPHVLQTPNIEDMFASPSDYFRSGLLAQSGWARSNNGMRGRDFRDVAIHPLSDNILVLDGNFLLTYSMDNFFEMGNVMNPVQIGTQPVALAVDPGPNPGFVLVADSAARKVLVGRLSTFSIRFNSIADYIQVNGCPVDVAVRTGKQFTGVAAAQPTAPANTGN